MASLKDNRKQFNYAKGFYQKAKDSESPVELVDQVAQQLGIDFAVYDREQFKNGLETESEEHSDVTNGDPVIAGRIAFAHLKEIPDYYTRLDEMEEEAKQGEKEEESNGEQSEY